MTGAEYSATVMDVLRPYVAANQPYVIAGAVVTGDHLPKVVAPVNRLTGRDLQRFDDVESAKAWLATRSPRAD